MGWITYRLSPISNPGGPKDPRAHTLNGEIAELKKRCKKETGLAAPRQPEFQAWALKFLEQQPKANGRIKMARG